MCRAAAPPAGDEDNDEVQTRSPATPGTPCSPTSPLKQKMTPQLWVKQTFNSIKHIEIGSEMSYLRAKWSHWADASLQDNKKKQLVQILQWGLESNIPPH